MKHQSIDGESTRPTIFERSDRKSLVDAGMIMVSPSGRNAQTLPQIPIPISNFEANSRDFP